MARADRRRHSAHSYSPNPRRHALEVVSEALSPTGRGFAQELLEERLECARLSPEDRRLTVELSFGVIRRLRTLDAILAAYAQRAAIDPSVRQVLRIGLYQLIFMERIPAHAAVDESVRLARATGKRTATGFVNAILRTAAREAVFSAAPDAAQPRRSFAIADGRAVTFARDFLPDPVEGGASQPCEGSSIPSQGSSHANQPCEGPDEPSQGAQPPSADWLGAIHSLPTLLVRRWMERFGAEQARVVCATVNDIPPTFARPNSTKVTLDQLQARLREEGVEAVPSPSGRTLRLPPHVQVAKLKSFAEGAFQVQDDSSAAIAEFIGVAPEMQVLDLCAAPGGKSCAMAERMRRRGQIIAVDSSQKRLARVVENMQRLDLPIIATVEGDAAEFARLHPGKFDRVLLDAPCSNTGVLRRRVEARWRFSVEALAELSGIQRRLLEGALQAVKPGGALVYSTCSLEAEENSGLVAAVLAERRAFRLEEEQQLFPSRDGGDGLYMARIARTG